jgi:hypothetical protein
MTSARWAGNHRKNPFRAADRMPLAFRVMTRMER